MQSYYPWNAQALIDWLNQEIRHCGDSQSLEANLKIPKHVIRSWLREASPNITLAQIRLIAHYRQWTLKQIIDWLQIQPAHLEELTDKDVIGLG